MNHQENQYLDLLQKILNEGVEKNDRTGVGTKSIFGAQMRFDLREEFPILTTKRVFWRGVVEELLWMLRGQTDSKILEKKGVNIWKGNTTREFLDKRGLNYPEGEIGSGYGFQLRNFDGEYKMKPLIGPYDVIWDNIEELEDKEEREEAIKQCSKEILFKSNRGIDQLKNIIDLIRNDPDSRRMVMTLWNPKQIDKMALPPCHGCLIQFYVANGELSCLMHQRSVDSLLGLPFNISFYAAMTYVISEMVNLKPGDLVWSGGDTHIYNNHIEQVKEQLSRSPYKLPKLKINKILNSVEDLDAIVYEDFELINYKYHPAIKAPMAI